MSGVNPGDLLATDLDGDETIVVDRRPLAIGAPPPGPGAAPESEADETIVVRRGATAPGSTSTPANAVADADADEDATIIVQRTGPAPATAADADADETVVVARRAPVPGRLDGDPDDDVEPADQTVVVERTVVRATPLPTDAHDGVMHAPTRRGRRVAPAPVSDDVLSTAEVGRGPGLLEHYAARPVAARPPAPRTFAGSGADPTRDPEQALPSVARRSRRSALVVLAAFASSCVLAAVGLVVVAVLALAG